MDALPLEDQVIVLAAEMDLTLDQAADIIAEVNRDTRPPVTIGNVTWIDFRAVHLANYDPKAQGRRRLDRGAL